MFPRNVKGVYGAARVYLSRTERLPLDYAGWIQAVGIGLGVAGYFLNRRWKVIATRENVGRLARARAIVEIDPARPDDMQQINAKPSKSMSGLGAFVGVIFIIVGIYMALYIFSSSAPWFAKAFIVLWTVIAAAIALYHCVNLLSHKRARGIADIEKNPASSNSTEERLRRLVELRKKGMIKEDEYQDRRKAIVNEL
jgi:hypothetical protein